MSISSDLVYDMWILCSSARADLIRKMPKEVVRGLRQKNLLTDGEISIAKAIYPSLFSKKGFTQEDFKWAALNDADYIRYVEERELSSEYIDNWISKAMGARVKPETYNFILKSQRFTEDQKVRTIYVLDGMYGAYSKCKEARVKLNQVVKDYCQDSRKIQLALEAKFSCYGSHSKDEDVIKDAVIQTFDEAYKIYKSNFDRFNDKHKCSMSMWILKSVYSLSLESIGNLLYYLESSSIFSKDYADVSQVKAEMKDILSEGEFTIEDIKKCHLEHLLPNTLNIIADL